MNVKNILQYKLRIMSSIEGLCWKKVYLSLIAKFVPVGLCSRGWGWGRNVVLGDIPIGGAYSKREREKERVLYSNRIFSTFDKTWQILVLFSSISALGFIHALLCFGSQNIFLWCFRVFFFGFCLKISSRKGVTQLCDAQNGRDRMLSIGSYIIW